MAIIASMYAVAFLETVVPLAIAAWLWFARPRSAFTSGMRILQAFAFLSLIALLLPWDITSRYLRPAHIVLFIAAAVRASFWAKRQPFWPETRPKAVWGLIGSALLLAAFGRALWGYLPSLETPGAALDLAFPLRAGTYFVRHGGSRIVTNLHVFALQAAEGSVRGQALAVDVTMLGRHGGRAAAVYAEELESYNIFGQPVYAPCDAVVIEVRDRLPDLAPSHADLDNPRGNYVLLKLPDGVHLLLAHLQQSSVTVAPGDRVPPGHVLGRVGNSGSTTEPHLHVHVQMTPGERGPLDGDPVPVTFNGRWLVRNDAITVE